MSINTYDEQKFWEEMDILFPDIVKAITSLAKKSYISITNLRNGVTWWSEKTMEYFGMQENYTIRGQEKSKRSIHPDDLEDFRRGFRERVAGKNMDEPWEYRVRDGSTYNRISARAKMLNDKDGKPFVIVIRYNNYGISDEVDATHSPCFNQVEGMVIDKNIKMADLKGTLDEFAKQLFGPETKTKFRPHHFPFTEPSAEMDVSCFKCGGKGCRFCQGTGWIEILGCGMVHPDVLEMCGIDSKEYTGFALGMGLERIALLKYEIDDLRRLYENDVRFLKQF